MCSARGPVKCTYVVARTAGTAFLRGSQLGPPQDAAHALAADHGVLLTVKFLAEMRIVEVSILAAGQFQDGAARSHR